VVAPSSSFSFSSCFSWEESFIVNDDGDGVLLHLLGGDCRSEAAEAAAVCCRCLLCCASSTARSWTIIRIRAPVAERIISRRNCVERSAGPPHFHDNSISSTVPWIVTIVAPPPLQHWEWNNCFGRNGTRCNTILASLIKFSSIVDGSTRRYEAQARAIREANKAFTRDNDTIESTTHPLVAAVADENMVCFSLL